MAKSTSDTDKFPNVVFVQLESFFDVSEYEAVSYTHLINEHGQFCITGTVTNYEE